MNEENDLPLSGYAISGVYTVQQSVEVVDGALVSEEGDSGGLVFGWDWRLLGEARHGFEVMVRIEVKPTQPRPYNASVAVAGQFVPSGTPSLPREEFVRLQAVAILLPYARAYLATLTQATPYGAFQLPTINVAELMGKMDPAKTTGAEQLRQGVSPDALQGSSSASAD